MGGKMTIDIKLSKLFKKSVLIIIVVLVLFAGVNIIKYSYGLILNNRVVYKEGFYYEELSS
jgi:hypothetical protein